MSGKGNGVRRTLIYTRLLGGLSLPPACHAAPFTGKVTPEPGSSGLILFRLLLT